MDTYDPVDEIRFYLRHCWRLRRSGRDPLTLPSGEEAALWERAQAAATRLQRLIERQPVPVPVERRHPAPPRRLGLN